MTRQAMKKAPGEELPEGVTRYRQLASVLRHRISSGEFPLGHQLPTVDSLAQTYGIAKVTVRQAFALLVEEGLISSQRGRGTHVIQAAPVPDERLRAAINDASVDAAGLQIQVLEQHRVQSLPPALAWHGTPQDRYVRVRKLHLHDGQPFCLIDMYVWAPVFDRFPAGGERTRKLLHLLREAEGERLGDIHQTLTVEPADFEQSRHLAYPFGSPVAKMVRTITDVQGRVLMAGLFWYRGDRFILDVQLPARIAERYPALAIPESRH